MLFVPSFVRSCHGSAGREAGRTARPRTTAHDHARPRMTDHARTTAHDRARPRTTDRAWPRMTAHDRARPRTTMHDRARPRTHDHALPRTTTHDRPRMTAHELARPTTHDRARPTTAAIFVWGSGTHPTPGGFRGLNCLARLALARERTPSITNLPLHFNRWNSRLVIL